MFVIVVVDLAVVEGLAIGHDRHNRQRKIIRES